VAQFVNYYLTNAPALVRQAKYVPLPASAYQTGLERVQRRQAGTAFGGKNDIGASIAEVLQRPLVLTPTT